MTHLKTGDFPTVTPHLVVKNASEAIDFYGKAFNAEELFRNGQEGGPIMHARLKVGNSFVMLNDEFPEHGVTGPSEDGCGVTVHIQVPDGVDELFAQAVDAGAKVVFPLANQFWGDRYGIVQDPYGHKWSLGQTVEKITPEEMQERGKNAFG